MPTSQEEAPTLEALREKAIQQDKAYGVTRLRSEFRMKPKADASPAYYSKNPYGRGENPCYKVADCVPLREIHKKPPTEKQRLAREISGIKSKLRSHYGQVSNFVAELLEDDSCRLVLDCETTGLGENAQVIELGLCDTAGNTVYCQRFKPTVEIEDGAYHTHGISMLELENEPSWTAQAETIRSLMDGKAIIIFNSAFDLRLIQQTNQAFGLCSDWVNDLQVTCAMEIAVQVFGSTNAYGTISLATSVEMAGVQWEGSAHSADGDAKATLGVLNSISNYWKENNRQLLSLQQNLKILNDA